MSVGCLQHPHEPAISKCRDCHFDYCRQCLVWPFGEDEAPFCRTCALVAAGIREKSARPRLVNAPASSARGSGGVVAPANADGKRQDLVTAPIWRRFISLVIDEILVDAGIAFAAWLGAITLFETTLDPETGVETLTLVPLGFLVAMAILFLHEVVFTFLFGGTTGKLLRGIRVVQNETGEPITFGKSNIRAAVKLFVPFSLFVALFTNDDRGLHDFAAGTRVVWEPA